MSNPTPSAIRAAALEEAARIAEAQAEADKRAQQKGIATPAQALLCIATAREIAAAIRAASRQPEAEER